MSLNKLGPYQFKGVLGRGGMGTVYRGLHQDLGELHAVKVLAPTYTDDTHFRGRFESEIKALLKLDHNNIVRLISYGQEDGMLFFAMELVEGNSLFQMQKKGHRFDWRQVLAIARDVCGGLRHAHDRGVIHRDLKPGNLLLATDPNQAQMSEDRTLPGIVKITDFGIAKSFGSSQNTGTNVLGTMDFMSPEQAKGQPVTFRSDLYSLGTVLYTLLAGKPPFRSRSVEESLRNLTQTPAPPISEVVPDVPPQLDALIGQLLHKQPEKRVPTALALLHRIDQVETLLRDHSEAKTADQSGPDSEDLTFDLADGIVGEQTKLNTGRKIKSRTISSRSMGRTAEYSEHDLSAIRRESEIRQTNSGPRLNRPSDERENYFNTVTDHLRQQQGELDGDLEERQQQGKLPLLIALGAVVAMIAFGTYQALKPPSADRLYEAVVAQEQNPDKVIDEAKSFLRLYPDDARGLRVSELLGIGNALRFKRRLEVRANLPGQTRLTPIEKTFLEIVTLAESNNTAANQKMNAFVTFYSSAPELSPRDQKVLTAGRSFRAKIRLDARTSMTEDLKQIRGAMETAAAAKNPADARDIYDSIIELYGNVVWGKEPEGLEAQRLVLRARDLLEQGN